ncbi:MAG: aspartate/glutamate racemase family protein [Burkholderiales bacterium]|nr:aspartate/glutamate racemase family protein [Burkholderiales bacterium]
MPRLLVLNPNTTAAVTDLVVRHVRDVLGAGVDCVPATARFGGTYISSEASYAIAGHAALDAVAAHGAGCDGVLLACFGDPGLFALREVCPMPVIGLAEAAMREAAAHGRFSIVTGGVLWKPMLERLAAALGHAPQVARIRTITLTGAQIAADPEGSIGFLADQCRAAAAEDGAQSVILGGAALAGMAARIAPQVAVPVIDSVHAGARVAGALAAAWAAAPHGASDRPATPTVGLSAALAALLA